MSANIMTSSGNPSHLINAAMGNTGMSQQRVADAKKVLQDSRRVPVVYYFVTQGGFTPAGREMLVDNKIVGRTLSVDFGRNWWSTVKRAARIIPWTHEFEGNWPVVMNDMLKGEVVPHNLRKFCLFVHCSLALTDDDWFDAVFLFGDNEQIL